MQVHDLITLVILAMVSFRVTRFFLFDSMFQGARDHIQANLFIGGVLADGNRKEGALANLSYKLYELFSCTWCLGFWVTLAVYGVYIWSNPTDWTRGDWILALATTTAAGFLHAFEPADE